MNKYNLTNQQLKQLRIVCKYTRLNFHAQAARPQVAERLIQDHLTDAIAAVD